MKCTILILFTALIAALAHAKIEFHDCPEIQPLWPEREQLVKCRVTGADDIEWYREIWYSRKPRTLIETGGRIQITDEGLHYDKVDEKIDLDERTHIKLIVVANDSVEVRERLIKIVVNEPITFYDCPETQYATIGENFVLECQGTAMPINYQYFTKNGKVLDPWKKKYNWNSGGIKIMNFQRKDAGVYKKWVKVASRNDSKSKSVTVLVRE